jgi:putative peptidoglycan lipid II flippase
MGYGVGLLGLVAVKVLAPGFYARQDMKTPVLIAIAMLVATQLMNLVFVPYLGHAGLALSIGIAALFNALLLLIGLVRRGIYVAQPGWPGFAARVALATAALGAGLAWVARAADWIALGAQPGLRIALLAAALAGAALMYFSALALMGVSPRQFVRRT